MLLIFSNKNSPISIPHGGRFVIANLRFIKGYEGNTLKLPPHFSLPIGKNSREVCHGLLSSIRILK